MKFRLLSILVICLMVSGAYASISGIASGNWTQGSVWKQPAQGTPSTDNDGNYPDGTTQEVKINGANDLVITINSDLGGMYTQKIGMARNAEVKITAGYLGSNRQIKLGDSSQSSAGPDNATITQTGGVLQMDGSTGSGKFMIGYKPEGDGTYVISGGMLLGGAGARLYVGCGESSGSIGLLKVKGSSATINYDTGDDASTALYVGNAKTGEPDDSGYGTVEFVLEDGAVSKIRVGKVGLANGTVDEELYPDAGSQILDLSYTGSAPTADVILLIHSTGTESVAGEFDNMGEGDWIYLGKWYMLTYLYDEDADDEDNDIALVIPEPATIALLSLGLFIIRRKK